MRMQFLVEYGLNNAVRACSSLQSNNKTVSSLASVFRSDPFPQPDERGPLQYCQFVIMVTFFLCSHQADTLVHLL